MPTPSMNLSELVAIDVHTHAEVSAKGQASISDELAGASASYFKVEGNRKPTVSEVAAYYRERKIAAVIFPVDGEAATGLPPVPNEEVAEAYWVSLDHLWDQRNATYLSVLRNGDSMIFPAIRFREHLIWGLTLRVLTLFSDALGAPLPHLEA